MSTIQLKDQEKENYLNQYYRNQGLEYFISKLPSLASTEILDDEFDSIKSKNIKLTFFQKLYGIPSSQFSKDKWYNFFDQHQIGRFSAVYTTYFHSLKLELFYTLTLLFIGVLYTVQVDNLANSDQLLPKCYFYLDKDDKNYEKELEYGKAFGHYYGILPILSYIIYVIFAIEIRFFNKKFKYLNGLDESDYALLIQKIPDNVTEQQILSFFQMHLNQREQLSSEDRQIVKFFLIQNCKQIIKIQNQIKSALDPKTIAKLQNKLYSQQQLMYNGKLKQGVGILIFRSIKGQQYIKKKFPNSTLGRRWKALTCRADQFKIDGDAIISVQQLPNPENLNFKNVTRDRLVSFAKNIVCICAILGMLFLGGVFLTLLKIKSFDYKHENIVYQLLSIAVVLVTMIITTINTIIIQKLIVTKNKNTIQELSCTISILIAVFFYSVYNFIMNIMMILEIRLNNNEEVQQEYMTLAYSQIFVIIMLPFKKVLSQINWTKFRQRLKISKGEYQNLTSTQIKKRLQPEIFAFKSGISQRNWIIILLSSVVYISPIFAPLISLVALLACGIIDKTIICKASRPLKFHNVSFGGIFYRSFAGMIGVQLGYTMIQVICFSSYDPDFWDIVLDIIFFIFLLILYFPGMPYILRSCKLKPNIFYEDLSFTTTYESKYPFNRINK